jgi:polysaccharide export outer membrane protein
MKSTLDQVFDVGRAAKPGRGIVMLALLGVSCCLPYFARAVGAESTEAQKSASSVPPTSSEQTNAIVPSPETVTNVGNGKDSTNAAAEVANVTNTASTNSMDTLDDRHKLAIGDRLSFRIVQDNEDPIQLSVTDSGELELPYIGRYPGVGKTCKDLARQVKAELEKEYYYHATVIIAVNELAKSQGKIYIMGPVRAPGPQDIPNDEVLTVSKAIMRAGGFGDYADRHKVEVRRKSTAAGSKDQVFTVDVAQIQEKGKSDADMPLEPGDIIFVPERLVRF